MLLWGSLLAVSVAVFLWLYVVRPLMKTRREIERYEKARSLSLSDSQSFILARSAMREINNSIKG